MTTTTDPTPLASLVDYPLPLWATETAYDWAWNGEGWGRHVRLPLLSGRVGVEQYQGSDLAGNVTHGGIEIDFSWLEQLDADEARSLAAELLAAAERIDRAREAAR